MVDDILRHATCSSADLEDAELALTSGVFGERPWSRSHQGQG
jgi:hypothetical protein